MPPPNFRHRRSGFVLITILPLCGTTVTAQSLDPVMQQHSEQIEQVVQGILGYSRWPQMKEQLELCVVGPTQYADSILASQPAENQLPVHSRRLPPDSPLLERQCDAIYIGTLDKTARQRLVRRLVGRPVLSISESNDACHDGSLFCLDIIDNHVSFAVNLDAVARSGIRIHPQVLQLGRRDREQP